jgi:hypothetical protein
MIELGRLVMTSGVSHWSQGNLDRISGLSKIVGRHKNKDWGEVCSEDWETNNVAVENGERILSSYTIDDEKLWVITEWDRSITTILFPSEY